MLISPEFVERHLGGHGLWPLLKASIFGVPLPLCSCGVIPVTMSLRKHGASKGAAISFLLSTPQTGADSVLVTYSLLGPVYAIFRPLAALVTGLVGGALVTVIDPAKEDAQAEPCKDECCAGKEKTGRLVRIFRYGFLTLPREIGRSMLVGLVIAAAIAAVIPQNYFAPLLGGGIVAMIVMMLLGIPVYVCATASVAVAVAVALISKGVSPGAALVFLMTGSAMAAGMLLDAFFGRFPGLWATVEAHSHEMEAGWFGSAAAVVLLAVLGWAIATKKGNHG